MDGDKEFLEENVVSTFNIIKIIDRHILRTKNWFNDSTGMNFD